MQELERVARYQEALAFAQLQVSALLENGRTVLPAHTRGGKWVADSPVSNPANIGYLTGMLWQFAKSTGDAQWRADAQRCAQSLNEQIGAAAPNALGLNLLLSHLPWYEVTGDKQVLQVLHDAGIASARRFQHRGRFFASCAEGNSLSIRTLMDVPLIQLVADATLDPDLARLVIAHGRTTRDQLVREDGSTARQIAYDPQSGEFIKPPTVPSSTGNDCHARSLAWAIDGFSKLYALTRATEFLRVAENNANYWLTHLPPGKVPGWNFSTTTAAGPAAAGPESTNTHIDSAAAAIAASGMLDLAQLVTEPAQAIAYRTMALATLDTLVEPEFLAQSSPGWEGILLHGVHIADRNQGDIGTQGVDESLACGDYFLVEALVKSEGGVRGG